MTAVLCSRPSTVAECDELLARVVAARHECCGTERTLICSLDDQIDELLAIRNALIPAPRSKDHEP